MRILLYSQFCAPEPIFKSVPFAKELARRGHEVRILTGFPNYPGGRIYPGYSRKLWQREQLDGIPILRTWIYPSHSASTVGRVLNYASFAGSSALSLIAGWRPDVVYVYNLITNGAMAVMNRALRGVPFAVDVTDLWPDSVFASNLHRGWMTKVLRLGCDRFYRTANRVVAVTPGVKRVLLERGVSSDRLRLIPNWCDENGLRHTPNVSQGRLADLSGRFNIVYAGNLGTVQALDSVIDAAAIAAKRNPQIQFVFMGSGVMADSLRKRAAQVAPAHTKFLPQGSLAEAAQLMNAADALLIHLKRTPLFEITIPSKTQAYLAMGKPILSAVAGDASDMVQSAQAGVTCEPENPQAIADAANKLAGIPAQDRTAMGRRGQEYYQRELSIEVGAARWEEVFKEIIRR